jgi:hypothetical protein
MNESTTQFAFDERVSMVEVAKTLDLARMACESLHGIERVALETASRVDPEQRLVSIGGSTCPGRDLAAMFLGYARREYGFDAMRVSVRNGGPHE